MTAGEEDVVEVAGEHVTMATRQLTTQTELVNQLDPERVFDYLLQHRTLDQETVDTIRTEEKLADRNIMLLSHLELLGNPAVELLINALRQSGQLHLASTLDVEHRIKPVIGKGYWEKQRYKGQITVSFQLVAAKVMVRKDSDEDKSPKIVDINAMLTPFKVKHSYENMTLIEDDENGPKARKILEYSYEEDPEDKSCCWCCIPFFCCSSRSKKKHKSSVKSAVVTVMDSSQQNHGAEVQRSSSVKSLSLYDVMVSLPSQPSSPIKSGSTFFKTRKLSPMVEVSSDLESPSSKSDSSVSFVNAQQTDALNDINDKEEPNVEISVRSDEVSFKSTKSEKVEKSKGKKGGKKKSKSDSTLETKNNLNGKVAYCKPSKKDKFDNIKFDNKENTDPCIWDLHKNGVSNGKKANKSSPPKTLDTTPTSAMKRSETYELVERWKSEGRGYQTARDQFFSFFDTNVQGRIIRYFEQERKTLVLQVNLDDKMVVCTISMTTREVKKLREDYEMGVLHEDLVRCVRPQDIVDKLECCAIHLRTVIDDDDFTLSFQELA
ncbi:hypothetical protein MAR_003935 [Mya arenaria]|uniref:CARD domain-containing protein n=1 Tax=Mya arenaria TaxID=6604 RepID=A0ABY7EVG7_MYAAR|nr:uncharacterized protein LOC128245642 [Mya arenaria]XP_052819808.1 uncharacterized protein LOC128245642 [Mya arenaria]XP_052819809.1 uncharacterized protein LOC128245642 [Mya arenaria]XP_052819810.1 uncharacterized protein LOC128245642 [Mya arenaria]XP_052819811.1 uncharacterized protein LOC128245642 [Mya arenaria]XP_052819812.1 uncharacterized protein LOC128245642 [Mya arenaria]XP_052819813.1 uncharacterized protein LOC128245642 [Mya arenaria]XP_052819814.1 uncharacterized protein LOC1282